MKKPLPPFIKEMQAKAAAKKGMHIMPDGKKMKDSAMKKPSAYAKGGFTKAADGVAQKGKTQAHRFDMGGGVMGTTAVLPVDPNTTVGPPPNRLYQSLPANTVRANPVAPVAPVVDPRKGRFRADRDAKRAEREDQRPEKTYNSMDARKRTQTEGKIASRQANIDLIDAGKGVGTPEQQAKLRTLAMARNAKAATALQMSPSEQSNDPLRVSRQQQVSPNMRAPRPMVGAMKKGGAVKPKAYASGGCTSSKPTKMARGGGCEIKGKTKGRYI